MLPIEMTFIDCSGFGGTDVLRLAACTPPVPSADEVLIKVAAAGVNRADIWQRQGKYPPPPGASTILGMEASGIVTAIGTDVSQWKIGDKVCALLAGGGYASYVTAPENHCLPVPENLNLVEAAALPEAIATVYANIFESGTLQTNETVLIHGGSSGIGTTAIQMAKIYGAKVFATVGSPEKAEACRKLGADLVIEYKQQDFVAAVQSTTNGRGVDIVLDMVGGDYINRNLEILAPKGRHISIATQSGRTAEVDLRLIMQKRLIMTGSTLRNRDKAEKARLIKEIETKIWPWVGSGQLKPFIYQRFPLKNASEAHKVMESSAHIGKMLLEVS